MAHSFETRTRKPTGNELRELKVDAFDCALLLNRLCAVDWPEIPTPAGSWIVDVLCLIPLHIAVAQDNRFIPLKDGLTSAEMQQSLLGAQVSGIVDMLSLGWYESIFSSYMSSRVSPHQYHFYRASYMYPFISLLKLCHQWVRNDRF